MNSRSLFRCLFGMFSVLLARASASGVSASRAWSLLLCLLALGSLPTVGATLNANFTSAATIPVTAASYTATGNTVNLTLGFAPPTGTDLTIVKNTGLGFISGQFDNLAQGQKVAQTYGGLTYEFVADYYGGTGNDLVLQWAYRDVFSWGSNTSGQLGNGSLVYSKSPVYVTAAGVLAGKTVVAVAAGDNHSMALCSDGTVAAWGYNYYGQLGNNSTSDSNLPVAVTNTGVLAGKTVVAVAAGDNHSMALCSDGTVAAWGYNYYGQLGNNSTSDSNLPVAVTNTGVLAGKTVVAISAGGYHSLALCSDGTVAAWGRNYERQLGNGNTTNSSVPGLVTTTGVLAGKTVLAVSAGSYHNLALCSDGTVTAWGYNYHGQLGIGSTTSSAMPLAVTTSGVLAGKTVVAVSAGSYHSIALCSDGTVVAWGDNDSGRLGNNSTISSSVPVAVMTTGIISGKTVIAVSAGVYHSLALCSDGTVAAWGYNSYGQLGNANTTDSSVPVAVTTTGVLAGKTVIAVSGGNSHSLALCSDGTVTAWGRNSDGQLGNNSTTSSSILSSVATDSSGALSGKTVITVSGGSSHSLALCSDGTVTAWGYNYYGQLGSNDSNAISSVPTAVMTNTGFLRGKTVVAISAGGSHSLAVCSDGTVAAWGRNNYGQLGNNSTTNSNAPVAVSTTGVLAGKTVVAVSAGYNHSLALCSDGTVLSWGHNLSGQLGNANTTDSSVPVAVTTTGVLAGKTVIAVSGGNSHSLALCSDGTVTAWGRNSDGQLGNNSTTSSSTAVAVASTGVLAGKTVVGISTGSNSSTYGYSLALCSDGTVAAWGYNYYGQLGNGNSTNSKVPVAVTTTGALAGKTVVAVSAGNSHSLALCSDGTVAAWGYNYYGQLGNNSTTSSSVPVAVTTNGALAGKTVTSVSAGGSHTLSIAARPLSPVSALSSLALDGASLWPAFNSATLSYSACVPLAVSSMKITPVAANALATVRVNGAVVASGSPSQSIPLAAGNNTITIVVTAQDGVASSTYTVTIDRSSRSFQSWVSSYQNLGGTTEGDDPDGDGLVNSIEYVLGGNPGSPSTAEQPVLASNADHFIFTFSRIAASSLDTTQIFQYSPDLAHWNDIPIDNAAGPETSIGGVDANGKQTITITLPVNQNQTMYGRLKVIK